MSARRDRYLAALGIPVLLLRGSAAGRPSLEPEHAAAAEPRRGVADARAPLAARVRMAAAAAGGPGPGAHEGGEAAPVAARPAGGASHAVAPTVVLPGTAAPGDWSELAAAVSGCTLCGLHRTRTQTVFGVGRRDADLLVIGEAPGADEDRQGEPFVGRAGQLLNAMLRAIGLAREDVYIANILKCRPPGNRDPQPGEAHACTPYLARQIALVRPRVILAVGRISAQWLLQTDTPIGRLRGRLFRYGEAATPLIVTYHPAYLLRTPLAKATAWSDLCMVREQLRVGS